MVHDTLIDLSKNNKTIELHFVHFLNQNKCSMEKNIFIYKKLLSNKLLGVINT